MRLVWYLSELLIDNTVCFYNDIYVLVFKFESHNIPNCMKEVTWLRTCLSTLGTGQQLCGGCLLSCRLSLYKQQW